MIMKFVARLSACSYELRQGNNKSWTFCRRYDLAGLKIVRFRLAGPCKWPATAGALRD